MATVIWLAVIAAAVLWAHGRTPPAHLQLGSAAPFYGTRRLFIAQLWPAVLVAVALLTCLRFADRLRWPVLAIGGWAAAAAWAVVLASSDGWHGFARSMSTSTEYRGALGAVGSDPFHFLRTFTTALHEYPTQVKGHPPLPLLLLWLVERMGLHGATWSAVFVIVVGSSAVVAVMVALRAMASEVVARQAAPWLIVAPGTAWVATSLDAAFMGVCAWGIALVALAFSLSRRRRAAVVAAFAAGVLLGCVPYLSYGLLPVGVIAAAVGAVAARRFAWRVWPIATAIGAGAASVIVFFTAAGFWWPAGVRATYHAYAHNYGSGSRPYWYFLLADVAVFALMIGPTSATAIARIMRERRAVSVVVLAALLAVAVSDASGFMRGEVERIWLPYAPWVVAAGACLRPRTRWLAVQLATAVAVQALVLSPW
jgi:hypothetical protein